MADTKEDGEVLSEGELEEGELLSSDEEEVSEDSPKAKQAASEPSKSVKADPSPQAAKRPAPEIEEAGAAILKKPRLEPESQIKSEPESNPDTAKEIFSDDEEAAYFPKLVKSRSLNVPPAPESTKSSPKGGYKDKYWQGSPQSSQEGSSESGDYGSGSEHHGRGKRKSTDQEEEDRKGKSERSDEKERTDRKRDYSHHSRSDHYSSPRRSSRRDTYDKDRERDKGGVSYRDQYGSRLDNYSKDRDHSRSGDEDGGSFRDQHGGSRDRDSHSKDRDQTANSDDGGTSYRNRDQYGKGGRRGHYHKQSPSHVQNPRQPQHQRYWDQSQSRAGGGYVAPGQMNTGMTAQQFHSLAAKVAQRRERGLSLLPTPRNISACNNLDQFNYPAPPSWYLEAVEEWDQERAKQTKVAAMEDKGESRGEGGGELRQDEAMDIDGDEAAGVGQRDAGKKDASEAAVAGGSLGVAGDIAAVGVVSEVSMATPTTAQVSSEMDVDTCFDKNAPDPAKVSTAPLVESSDSVMFSRSETGGETKSDLKRTETETPLTGPVPALAAEEGGNQEVGEQSKGASESSQATAIVGIPTSAAQEGADAIKEKLPGVPLEKTPKTVPLPKVSSGAASDDNLSDPEVDDFDYDKYLDQLDEEEDDVGKSDLLSNPLSEDFPRVGPADEKSTTKQGKSAGHSLKSLVKQEIDLTVASDEAKDAPPPTKNDAKRPNKSARRLQKEAAWRARQQEREAAAAKKLEEAALPRPKLPCRYYMTGFCRHGDNCSYSHVVPREKKKEVCKFYLQNACSKGEECAYYHSKFPCKFFHTKSYCNFGNQCKFSHDPLTPETHELLMTALEPSMKLPVPPISGYDGTRDGGSVPAYSGGMQAFGGGIQTNTGGMQTYPGGMQTYPGSIQTNPGGIQTYPGRIQVQGPPQSQIEPSGTHMQASPVEGVRFPSSGGGMIGVDPHGVRENQNEPVARQQQQWETQPRGDGPPKESENGLVVSIPKKLAQESLVVSIPRSKLIGRFHSTFTAMPVAVVSVSTTQQHPAAVAVQSFGTGMGPQPDVPVPPLGFPPIPNPNPLVVPTQLSSQPIPLFPPKPKPLDVGQTSQVSSEPPRRALLPTPPPHMKLAPEDLKRMEMAQPEYWESPALNQMQGPQGPASQLYPPQGQQTYYPQNGGGPMTNNGWNTPAYNVRPPGMGPRQQRQGGMDPRQGNTDLRQEGMGPRPTGPEMGHGGFIPRPGGFDPRQGHADMKQMHVPPRPPAPSQPPYGQPPPPPPPPPNRVDYQQPYQQPPYQQQQQPQWMGPDSIPHHPPLPPQLPPPQHPTPLPFHPRPDSHTQIPHPPVGGLPAPFGSLPPVPPEKTSPAWGLGTSPEHIGSPDSNYLLSPSTDPRRVDPRTKYAHLKIKPKGQSASPQQQQPSSTSSILKKTSSSGKPSETSERPEHKQELPFKIPKLLQNPLSLDKPLDPRELFGSNEKGLETEQEYGEITAPFGSFRPFFSRSSQAGPSSSEHESGAKQPFGEITLEHQEKRTSPPPQVTRTAQPEEKEVEVSPSASFPPKVPSYLASLDVGLGGGSSDLTIDSAFSSLGDKSKEQGVAMETSKEPQTAKKLPSIFGLGLQ